MKKPYGVFDSENQIIKCFETYKQAFTFKITSNRHDWTIKYLPDLTD